MRQLQQTFFSRRHRIPKNEVCVCVCVITQGVRMPDDQDDVAIYNAPQQSLTEQTIQLNVSISTPPLCDQM